MSIPNDRSITCAYHMLINTLKRSLIYININEQIYKNKEKLVQARNLILDVDVDEVLAGLRPTIILWSLCIRVPGSAQRSPVADPNL
jgi:hypothetical protein